MLKKLQKIGFGLVGSLLISSFSNALECPAVQDFTSVVQLPPFAFNPQTNQLHFYSLASNFDIDIEHENTRKDWLMILDIKADAFQLTENHASNLIQNLSRHQEQSQLFSLDKDHKIEYCLYHSNDNPKVGAIAYHLPEGVDTSNQAHLRNFIRSIALK